MLTLANARKFQKIELLRRISEIAGGLEAFKALQHKIEDAAAQGLSHCHLDESGMATEELQELIARALLCEGFHVHPCIYRQRTGRVATFLIEWTWLETAIP